MKFRSICTILMFLAMFYVWGVVGGIEAENVALGTGFLHCAGGVLACLVFGRGAGIL